MFKKAVIVGTGLIGGSLALVLKKKRLAKQVYGISRHKESLLLAKRMGAIDCGSLDLAIAKDADLLILALPVSVILKTAPQFAKIINKGCIVCDVGSTKEEIVSKLDKIFSNYVGMHPMAGSEKRGIKNARIDIFDKTICILTPTKKTNKRALKKIKQFWLKLGVKIMVLSSSSHDQALSFVSHLPHVAAFSLISTVPEQYFKFASSGLKDTTRIAGSDAELWADIFLSNQKNIVKSITAFENNLRKIKNAVSKKDKKLLAKILAKAKNKRGSL